MKKSPDKSNCHDMATSCLHIYARAPMYARTHTHTHIHIHARARAFIHGME